MALPNYGVLAGTFDHFEQEPKDNYGRWYHGFVFVNVGSGIYKCAVDVYKPDGGFQYMLLALDKTLFTDISALANGYHELTRDPTSGAIDYIRSPIVNQAKGCLAVLYTIFNSIFGTAKKVWMENTGDNALNALTELVTDSTRVYVFGAPFHTGGDGMHDVHMNQGDPPGPFQHLDAIWQDGCVIVEKPDGSLKGYFGKFVTQLLQTDDQGLPI